MKEYVDDYPDYILRIDVLRKMLEEVILLLNDDTSGTVVEDLYSRVNFMVIGDSFLIFAECESDNFEQIEQFIDLISLLQYKCFIRNIFFRGAICLDDLLFESEDNKFVLFGKAFTSSHDLEKKAKYPRVVLSERLVEILNPNNEILQDDYGLIKFQEFYYIHFLSPDYLIALVENLDAELEKATIVGTKQTNEYLESSKLFNELERFFQKGSVIEHIINSIKGFFGRD